MAAPTNVRVEAIAPGTTIVRWTYSGASALKVYRSTDGSSYSVVATLTSSDTQYIDESLAEHTKYWYKVSDDNGSTFSSVVTVMTYVLDSRASRVNQTSLNTFSGSPEDVAWQLQEAENKHNLEKTPCDVCLVEGSMVLDCSTGCNWFRVVVDQDINSISIIGCETCPPTDFIIPPGETFGLCGWPIGCEYTRDECFDAPVSGGTGGRTAKTNGLSYGGYGSTGGGPSIPTQSCPCDSALDHNCTTDCLRIVCCD
jgi:hypothetical protein